MYNIYMSLHQINVPDIDVAVPYSKNRDEEPTSYNALDEVNAKRLLTKLQQQVSNILPQYMYEPNNEETRLRIRSAIEGMCSSMNLDASVDAYSVDVSEEAEYDELARSCTSYKEYCMKRAIISGDVPAISEEDFWKRHNYDPNALNLNISIKPTKVARMITLNCKLSY